MKKMLITMLFVVVLVSIALYAFAPHVPAAPKQVTNQTELEAYLNQLAASGNPPGLSVVVVKDDKVVYSKAFGYADGTAENQSHARYGLSLVVDDQDPHGGCGSCSCRSRAN